jgi:hypothetical protein
MGGFINKEKAPFQAQSSPTRSFASQIHSKKRIILFTFIDYHYHP